MMQCKKIKGASKNETHGETRDLWKASRASVLGRDRGEAISTCSVDHNTSIKMLKEVIFSRFGVPRYLMTDGGSHFSHGAFRKMLAKYDVNHRIASPYHPQSTGQVELRNRDVKLIFQKSVNTSRRNWSKKLDDVLWAYRTAYKNPMGIVGVKTGRSWVAGHELCV